MQPVDADPARSDLSAPDYRVAEEHPALGADPAGIDPSAPDYRVPTEPMAFRPGGGRRRMVATVVMMAHVFILCNCMWPALLLPTRNSWQFTVGMLACIAALIGGSLWGLYHLSNGRANAVRQALPAVLACGVIAMVLATPQWWCVGGLGLSTALVTLALWSGRTAFVEESDGG